MNPVIVVVLADGGALIPVDLDLNPFFLFAAERNTEHV